MIFVVDGNNLAYRANYVSDLYSPDGTRTSGIYGFFNVLTAALRRYEEYKISKIVVCWDRGGSEWRKKLYPEYKAHRSENRTQEDEEFRDDLMKQISRLKKILRHLGVYQYSSEGVEADDIMAKLAFETEEPMMILSGDKDIIQLVSNLVSVIVPHKDNFMVTKENFKEYTGFRSTRRYITYLSLLGDKTDNITKIPGVGEKTAKDAVDRFGSIKNIIKASKTNPAMAKKFGGQQKLLKRNFVLMKLDYFYNDRGRHLDDEIMVDKGSYDKKWVKKVFMDLDFQSFLDRFEDFAFLFDRVQFRGTQKEIGA